MLNKAIWKASSLSFASIFAVSSMLSVGSFAQDSEFVEEVVSIGTRGSQDQFLALQCQLMF